MTTSDRFPYLTANTLDQDFLDDCFSNLTNNLELIVEIESPSGTLFLSDRNKYVGDRFYEARLKFPTIKRTIGEYLSESIQFSQITLEINNADKKFNEIMPSGSSYNNWVGRVISVKMGLRDVESTYKEIFRGKVTEQGGFGRSVESFTLIARNDFELLDSSFPSAVLKQSSFPDLESEYVNKLAPVIYGDWTVHVIEGGASVPCYPLNGANANVNGDTSNTVELDLFVSANDNLFFDTSEVYVVRSEIFYKIDASDVINLSAGKNSFSLRQSGTAPAAVSIVDGSPFSYKSGDKIFCKLKGKDLGAYSDNILWQARDILKTYGGLVDADFDSSWETYRDKAAPAESAISLIKGRAWIGEQQKAMSYALSMLEQVRLEGFIDRNLKMKVTSLHLDDFEASPSFKVKNWDLARDSFRPYIDDRNNFNRVGASFNLLPNINENYEETPIYRNQAAITQLGREISKRVIFPNLYVHEDVKSQVQQILRVSSATIEVVEFDATWRLLLLDVGDFVQLNIDIGSVQFDGVPAIIREIGYDSEGMKLPIKIWSLQMLPFTGYTPTYSGTVGGSTAIITEE